MIFKVWSADFLLFLHILHFHGNLTFCDIYQVYNNRCTNLVSYCTVKFVCFRNEMEPRSSCYCCVRLPQTHSSRMDIDTALNELGMLSSVTESRRQFMRERELFMQRRASRERFLSEPSEGQSNGCPKNSEFDTISGNLATSLQTPDRKSVV